MTKDNASSFGFSQNVLPDEIERLIEELDQIEPGGSYRTEARHYWKESCNKQFEIANDFIADALHNIRFRFSDLLDREDD